MALSGWPTVTDDDGSKQTGTRFNAALVAAIRASIEAFVVPTNVDMTNLQDLYDEIEEARGSLADLNARLSVHLNPDGTPIEGAAPSSADVGSGRGDVNLAPNSRFMSWPDGVTSAPAGYTLSGATIQKTGPGEADTQQLGGADHGFKLTFAAGVGKLICTLVPAGTGEGEFTSYEQSLEGRVVHFVALAKPSGANVARLVIDDGDTVTQGSYAPNVATPSWIITSHTISTSATKLEVYFEVTSGSAYYESPMIVVGTVAPSKSYPPLSVDANEGQDGLLTAREQSIGGRKNFFEHPWFTPGNSDQCVGRVGGALVGSEDITTAGTALAAETTLYTYTLDADTLDRDGAVIEVFMWGTFAANANAKTLKMKFGATSVTVLNGIALNGGNWRGFFRIVRTAAGTQLLHAELAATASGSTYLAHGTGAEDLTTDVIVLFTGQATANNDITCLGGFAKII
jgi:hypothetical protein